MLLEDLPADAFELTLPPPILGELPGQPLPRSLLATRGLWVAGWAARVAEFSFVESWVQLFGALAGLLIVRALAKEQYALYAIVNQMQVACNLLADLGIGIG